MALPITGDLVLLFLAVIGGIAGLWWRIEARFASAEEARTDLQRELSEYKLYVSQNHVSATALRESEQRLITAIEKLAGRLEMIVNRLDALANRHPV